MFKKVSSEYEKQFIFDRFKESFGAGLGYSQNEQKLVCGKSSMKKCEKQYETI